MAEWEIINCDNKEQIGFIGELVKDRRSFYYLMGDLFMGNFHTHEDEIIGLVNDKQGILFEKTQFVEIKRVE